MKKSIIFAILLSFLLTNCNSQNKPKQELVQKDSIKPQTKIRVNKEYDEQGNLISIDSSYSYFYSNIKNDTLMEKEIFDKFKLDFDNRFTSLDSIFSNDFFKGSPFEMNDFYTNDFFQDNFKLHQDRMNKMLKEMDSIKNNFYKKESFIIKPKN